MIHLIMKVNFQTEFVEILLKLFLPSIFKFNPAVPQVDVIVIIVASRKLLVFYR